MKLAIVVSAQPASFSAVAYKGELEANIKKLASLGYDGVELAVRDPLLLEVDTIQILLRDLNLDVPALGTGQAYQEEGLSLTSLNVDIRNKAIRRIKAQIDLAENFGAVVIIGMIRGKIEETRAVAEEYLVWALKECCVYAEKKNVRLALEPVNRYETDLINTVAEGMQMIDKVGAASLGLLLDTFHMNIEERAIENSIRMAANRILHFHVADSNRWYPGAGHVDFPRVVEVLQNVGYNCYLSAEIMPLPDPDLCAKETIAFLTPMLR